MINVKLELQRSMLAERVDILVKDYRELLKAYENAMLLQDIYDKEQNISLTSFWAGGWKVKLGDEQNGFTKEAGFETMKEVYKWLKKEASQ